MHAADNEPDAERRAALMSRAEQLALDEAPVCTTVFGVSKNLVDPRLGGWSGNLVDIHRARWFTPA
jgi:oligopeptide transport system substrate-binding protein